MRFTAAVYLAVLLTCLVARAQTRRAVVGASEHFLLDQNRVFVPLEFACPDGKLRRTLAFVDSGDPSFEFSLPLVKEPNIDKDRTITVRFGGMGLKVPSSIETSGHPGGSMFPGMTVEANLPATILAQYDVVLDYRKQVLTLAPSGSLKHQGVRIPCKVNPKTGLISVAAEIDGQSYAFAIDVGSAYTWLDQTVAKKWASDHPRWVRGIGAVGDANMNGSIPELTGMIMRVPAIDLGGVKIERVGALGVGPGWDKTMPKFFEWYSKKTPEPVAGFLGGNILRAFRLEIDYANRATYWSRESADDSHDLDQVGIMIQPATGGKYVVMSLPTQNGRKMVEGVAPNDRLISVDGAAMTGATMGKVLKALHGEPGEIRMLTIERNGRRLIVKATVTRF